MTDVTPVTKLPQTAVYDATNDFFMIVTADASGVPVAGPRLLSAASVIGTGGTVDPVDPGTGEYGDGAYGGGQGNPLAPVQKVFGRDGNVVAQFGDYAADDIPFNPSATGVAASNVQDALDAIYFEGGGSGSGITGVGAEGQIATLDGTGAAVWSDPNIITVFGRDGIVTPQTGDYNSDQVTEGSANKYMTAAERSKLALLSDDLQLPDPAGESDGQYLKTLSGEAVWGAAPAGGGSGSLPQINLLALATPLPSAPPECVYLGGVPVWKFSNAGSDELRFAFLWPGGTATLTAIVSAETATSGNVGLVLEVFAATSGDATALYPGSFASNTSSAVAVPGVAGRPVKISFTISNTQSAAADDYVRVKLRRDTAVASNAAGNMLVNVANLNFS